MGYTAGYYTDTAPVAYLTPDVLNKLIRTQPDAATLTTVLMLMKNKNRTVFNSTHTNYERDNVGRWTTIPAGGGDGDLSLGVTSGDGWKVQIDTLLKCPRTGEVLLVTGVSTDTITVTRSAGATAAAVLNLNEPLMIIGTAKSEGYSLGVAGSSSRVAKTFYTQIFSNPFQASRTAKVTKTYTGQNVYAEEKLDAFLNHVASQDAAALFGETFTSGSGSSLKRAATSATETISSNVASIDGTLTEVAAQNAMRPIFELGSPDKILVGSSLVCDVFSNFSTNKLQTNQGQSEYGNRIKKYNYGSGSITLTTSRLTLAGPNQDKAFVFDTDNLYRIVLPESDTHVLEYDPINTQSDAYKGEWKTEAGFVIALEKAHMRFVGVTG
jgi:hypothetical protein